MTQPTTAQSRTSRCGCDPGHDDCVCGCHGPYVEPARACPHTDRSEDALCVIPAIPRGAHHVICPCCGLSGWQTDDDDGPPMVCPDCLVEARRGN